MTRLLFVPTVLVALAAAPAGLAASLSDTFTSFYVLGDSNSDFGNLGPNGPPPPYFNSQFSNGPVWADLLDDPFQTGDPDNIRTWNYAFGGARVTETSNVPDLPAQIGLFGADLDPTQPDPLAGTPVLGERPLVSVWFGANDIRAVYQDYLASRALAETLEAADQPAAIQAAQDAARAAAANVGAIYGATLQGISQNPAFGDLLAMTTGDAGATPEYDSPTDIGLLTELSLLFNDQLRGAFAAIENTGVNVYTVDIFALQQQVAATPAAFGFDNVTDPCLSFGPAGASLCSTPETYLFWDDIGHLSGAGHAALAGIVEQTIAAELAPAPVPLPASLCVLAAGLAFLGAIGRRSRACRTDPVSKIGTGDKTMARAGV